MAVVADIIALMDQWAPRSIAEEWDNPGLQVGSPAWPVKKIMIALDATPAVVMDACQQNADLLITHHPFIFKALRNIDYSTPLGQMIEMAVNHHLSYFSTHTNLDWTAGRLNDAFSEISGLKHVTALEALPDAEGESGLGRIGELETPVELAVLAQNIRSCLGIQSIRVAGPFDLMTKRVAVCTGSGSGLLKSFFASNAHVFVSGDLRYHDARDAELYNRGLIDVGHFASEHIVVGLIQRKLAEGLSSNGHEVAVAVSTKESEPFINI